MPQQFTLKPILGPGVHTMPSLVCDGMGLPQWFGIASGNQLELSVPIEDPVQIDGPSHAVGPVELRFMIDGRLNNTRGEVARALGLLFCRRWDGGHGAVVLGLMFDLNTSNSLGEFKDTNRIPREAAAVFLDPFHDTFGEGTTRAEEAIAGTACHEVGHIFNLTHDKTGQSFMATGHEVPSGFRAKDDRALKEAGRGNPAYAERHLPGLSPFREQQHHQNSAASLRKSKSLRLSACLDEQSILPGEPVVLQIELENIGRRSIRLMPRLDPGYADFEIWYTTPEGERLRYRPYQRYCDDNTSHMMMRPGERIEHNPRVHHDARGLCFTQRGVYTVWTKFNARNGRRVIQVESNRVTFEVRSPKGDAEHRASALFAMSRVSMFVTHKGGPIKASERKMMRAFAEQYPQSHSGRHLRYALAADSRTRRGAQGYLDQLTMPEHTLQESVERLKAKWSSDPA